MSEQRRETDVGGAYRARSGLGGTPPGGQLRRMDAGNSAENAKMPGRNLRARRVRFVSPRRGLAAVYRVGLLARRQQGKLAYYALTPEGAELLDAVLD